MRRRSKLLLSGLIPVTVLLAVGIAAVPASAAPSGLPHVVTTVTGTSGNVVDLAISPDGSSLYIVDGSDTFGLVDTSSNSVIARSFNYVTEGFPLPTQIEVAPDTSTVFTASDPWLVATSPGGVYDFTQSFGVPFDIRSLAPVPGGPTVMLTPTTANPTDIYRVNLGVSVSPVTLTPQTPSTVTTVAVGPGTGNDNDVVVAGTAGGVGVVYVFDSPFELGGPNATVVLPLSTSASSLALDATGTKAIALAPTEASAYLVDVAGGSVIGSTVDTSVAGAAAAFSPDGTIGYVVGSGALDVIDGTAGGLLGTVPLGIASPVAIAVSPSGNRMWVGDAATGDVVMLSYSAMTGAASTDGGVGTALSVPFAATNFDVAPTYSVSPALPAGLSINPSTGVVSGTPTAVAASAVYTVTATSTDGDTASAAWSLTVGLPSTGSDDLVWVGVGLALLMGGLLLVGLRGRRARA
jgi:LPXTG-motif cell wall-anchored protein